MYGLLMSPRAIGARLVLAPCWAACLAIFLTAFLTACNPTLNWRETSIAGSPLVALLPCKPDHGSRVVPLAGRDTELHMTGCDAGGATFAVARVDIAPGVSAPDVIAQWRSATLARIGAVGPELGSQKPLIISGAGSGGAPLLVVALGKRANASTVTVQAVWFTQGAQVFHAAVYANVISPEASEVFFSGLKFQ